jgi:hypothetical protein
MLVTDFTLLSQGRPRPEYLWDCPRRPNISQHQWYTSDNHPRPFSEGPFRMRHVDVSGDLRGLTVSYGNCTNMSFHAHNRCGLQSGPSPSQVEWMYGEELTWVYFPLSSGEKICGIWILTLPGGLATVAVSMFIVFA